MPIPDIHHHNGQKYLCEPLYAHLRTTGEPQRCVETGHWCDICGFIPGPVGARMRLGSEMRFLMTEEGTDWEEPLA